MFGSLKSTLLIGKTLIHLPTCHSTNDFMLKMINDASPVNGTIIITSEQTKGKGQRGNRWLTEPGKNLTFSILLDTSFLSPVYLFNLTIALSLGIIKGLESHKVKFKLPGQFKIKWPNDIYYNEQKLGGILIENIIRGNNNYWAVAGIGININQTDFKYLNATSLKKIAGDDFDLPQVMEDICFEIEQQVLVLQNGEYENLKTNYLSCLYRFGKLCTFKSSEDVFEGKIANVNEEGRLGITINDKVRYFGIKEVVYDHSIN